MSDKVGYLQRLKTDASVSEVFPFDPAQSTSCPIDPRATGASFGLDAGRLDEAQIALGILLDQSGNLYAPDKRLPSVAGTYLAACTTCSSLFGKSPVGLAYTAGLDADTAAFLQNVAGDTVQDYLKP